jgi:hypothetical protein
VFAKVVAYNIYGDSETSDPGSEAIILTIPDAPVSLTETVSARTENTITFSWNDGAQEGGAPILDYRINLEVSGSYTVLESNVLETSFTATGLTAG